MSYSPYEIHGADRDSAVVVICDHASNRVPPEINGGDLGLPPKDMQRHIAFDVGAAGLSRALADEMQAPAVFSRFSRLVIDPNRGLNDPTLLMRLYDGSLIPANRNADDDERNRRIESYYVPYHAALERQLARHPSPVLVSVHSFTPRLNGRKPRPWHIGILSAHDRRLAEPVLSRLRAQDDLCVGDNEPYRGHLPGDTIDRHGLQHDRLNILIELRNDLISEEDQQVAWARRLAPILQESIKAAKGA